MGEGIINININFPPRFWTKTNVNVGYTCSTWIPTLSSLTQHAVSRTSSNRTPPPTPTPTSTPSPTTSPSNPQHIISTRCRTTPTTSTPCSPINEPTPTSLRAHLQFATQPTSNPARVPNVNAKSRFLPCTRHTIPNLRSGSWYSSRCRVPKPDAIYDSTSAQ